MLMINNKHIKTPFFTKLKEYGKSNVAPFDVPGHKLGKIDNDLIRYVGKRTYLLDSNSPIGLDHLNKPTGVIRDAENLMADACHAEKSYFLTNGTTTGILAMIMSVCKANDKIILPRNVHKSVINGLILSGAIPIFIKPNIDQDLGIANDVTYEAVERAINENPDAVAVFVINPTYFGVISDLKKITDLAHENDIIVMVDEAHGAQFYFSQKMPLAAMEAGADISATSMHKTAGSFTQSSIILTQGKRINHQKLRATLNMLQSTSPSSLLMASIDVARKTMYFKGEEKIAKILEMAHNTREKLKNVPGITVIDKEYIKKKGCFDYDETKIIVKVSELGLSGFEVYQLMKEKYNIQLELAESHIVLAIVTIGSTRKDLDRLYKGFLSLSNDYHELRDKLPKVEFEYMFPETYSRPRDAYHAPKLIVSLDDAVNEVAGESVMIYPPGIPIVIPGEVITQDVIDDIKFYSNKSKALHSDLDDAMITIVDKENWMKFSEEI